MPESEHQGGVEPARLDEHDLQRELEAVHRSRHDTFMHGSPAALQAHSVRMRQLEEEYVRRHPERHVTPGRTREGTRRREK
ncbi:DUF6158 family protein [Streptomyces hypolithicus]